MPFSVALQQPKFAPGDDGGLGDWSDVLTGIANIAESTAKVGVAYLQSRPPALQTQTQIAAMQRSQLQPVSSITSSPLFLPVVGGLALLLVFTLSKGRR
jgi:hypothetical protein